MFYFELKTKTNEICFSLQPIQASLAWLSKFEPMELYKELLIDIKIERFINYSKLIIRKYIPLLRVKIKINLILQAS